MASESKNLLIILGPTSVGKSVTAVKLARIFNGEIINCDSMQVYEGFDIGTDKIPVDKRGNIPHHLLDVIDPSVQFTAAEFVKLALKAIAAIEKEKKLPILVGGTGLYLKALLNGLFPQKKIDPSIRQRLEKDAAEKGLKTLWAGLARVDPGYAKKIGPNDRIRIIRALEVYEATQIPISQHFIHTKSPVRDFHIIKIGLQLRRNEIYKKIEERVDRMFEKGIVNEVEVLLQKGVPENASPFRALGYKHVLQFLRDQLSLEEAIRLTKRDTRHYAKRQITWFRKMEGIHWFSPKHMKKIQNHIQNNLM